MSAGRRSSTTSYAPTHKYYAASTPVDCVADSPDGASCAAKICVLAAGNFTVLKDADGVDKPFNGAPTGYVHDSDVSAFTCSQPTVVYWGRYRPG